MECKDDPGALHVIIFDEFDALGAPRGGGGASTTDNVRDSVVNQLLTKIDGVAELALPTLVIGLTNRRDLIDPALLRPGRFEVHIRVPLPDTAGRAEILTIHLRRMFERGRLADVPDQQALRHLVERLAAESDGLSGADLAGVVRAAASRALERFATKEWQQQREKVVADDGAAQRCVVRTADLVDALREDQNEAL